jgi:hypothetical protein
VNGAAEAEAAAEGARGAAAEAEAEAAAEGARGAAAEAEAAAEGARGAAAEAETAAEGARSTAAEAARRARFIAFLPSPAGSEAACSDMIAMFADKFGDSMSAGCTCQNLMAPSEN